MISKHALLPACALALLSTAAAQSGRTMTLSAPAAIGYTSDFVINHPLGAGGNYYVLLWSTPFPGTVNLGLPDVIGLVRVDLSTFVTPFTGFLANATSTAISFTVPNNTAFLGFAFDVQSADLDAVNNLVMLADNDLEIVVSGGICEVNLSRATTTSTSTGDNDIRTVNDQTVGAPVSQGLPTFAYLVTRHRGDEGVVEGYAGTFSATPHNSDIDAFSGRRVGRRLTNAGHQAVSCPNGYDISLIRDRTNVKQFGVLSYERATGTARLVPGATWLDTSVTATPAQQTFYPGFSRDGQWCVVIAHDSNTVVVPDRVLAFRTDGQSAAIDITATTPVSTTYFDATIAVTNDFIFVVGSSGWFWTSATAPATLQSLAVPNTTATGAPAIWVFPFSWRVSPDGATCYFPVGSNAAASRGEMDIIQVTNVAGAPSVANYTQFPVATGVAEFGYSAISPATTTTSSNGIKASVSPDGTKLAFLAATSVSTSAFPGLYVADGTANPTLRTVPGALFYSEVAFINNTTVLFFAGASSTTQSFYSLDVPTGTITQIGTAIDHRTRGQLWSLNKNFWYFIRSTSASTVNDVVGVNCATGVPFSVTGVEFGTPGPVGTIRTGSFNTTTDPWFALEMQFRRAAVGDYIYFTARRETGTAAVFEDSNVFRFDAENGGQATMLTSNLGTGALTAIKQNESLVISDDGNHVAWGQRTGTVSTNSEDVFHLDLNTMVVAQRSVSAAGGQSITDGSIRFTCAPVLGLVWSIGTGSTTVPTANARIEWAAISGGTPVSLTGAPAGTQLFQVLGTNN